MIKTVKEDWTCPDVQVQLFVPQDCVAACSPITRDMARYLDLDKDTYHDNNEEIQSNGLMDVSSERTYYNVSAYSSYERHIFSEDNYTGYITTYPIVDIRDVGGIWIIFRYYMPYNATS